MHRSLLLICATALGVGACSAATPSAAGRDEAAAQSVLEPDLEPDLESVLESVLEPIVLPLSLYVVLDSEDDSGDSLWSSKRQEADLLAIAEAMGAIWASAGIEFGPVNVATIEVPTASIQGIARLEPQAFLAGAGFDFEVPDPGVINGFYVAEMFGVNGFAPAGTRTFFVTDKPSVHDERVSSHEVGHQLGLHHVLDDSGRLMFGGTNGMDLTTTEATVARYFARGVLDAVR